jgi:hypothetical protein
MELDDIWSDIELNPPAEAGIVTRLVEPDSARSLFVGTAFPSDHRMLILRTGLDAVAELENLPSSRAVQMSLVSNDDSAELRVELLLESASDVFTAFAANLAAAILKTQSDKDAVSTLVGKFHSWRRFFSGNASDGLSENEAQGLWGELWVMRHLLFPIWGGRVVASWTGPGGDDIDYRAGLSAAEVKTLRGDQPAVARITSERQLDPPVGTSLVLIAVLVDRHRQGAGESLTEMVTACFELFEEPEKFQLDDLLSEYGYLEIHRAQYEQTRYSIREVRAFHVRDRFPRITESELPEGVGSVKYSLALSACQEWAVNLDRLEELLPVSPVE